MREARGCQGGGVLGGSILIDDAVAVELFHEGPVFIGLSEDECMQRVLGLLPFRCLCSDDNVDCLGSIIVVDGGY